jgi:hypothetical protein
MNKDEINQDTVEAIKAALAAHGLTPEVARAMTIKTNIIYATTNVALTKAQTLQATSFEDPKERMDVWATKAEIATSIAQRFQFKMPMSMILSGIDEFIDEVVKEGMIFRVGDLYHPTVEGAAIAVAKAMEDVAAGLPDHSMN